MACCVCCNFQGNSKTLMALLVPALALFARLSYSSSLHVTLVVVSIPLLSVVAIAMSSFRQKSPNQKTLIVEEAAAADARKLLDLYSESDSSSSSSQHEGGGSDDSIYSDDEDSLFEIAIPKFFSLHQHEKDEDEGVERCRDFMAEVNEDNLIEIDINRGSIKYCSSFSIPPKTHFKFDISNLA